MLNGNVQILIVFSWATPRNISNCLYPTYATRATFWHKCRLDCIHSIMRRKQNIIMSGYFVPLHFLFLLDMFRRDLIVVTRSIKML
jgi:hypothetical protein